MDKIINFYSQLNGLKQKDVEFVNLILGRDNYLFLDFNRILLGSDLNSRQLRKYINSYMNELMGRVLRRDNVGVGNLLEGIHESNETYLGLSKATDDLPKGNSIGRKLKNEVLNNIATWFALFRSNPVIDSFQYGIKEIGPDRISDIVTSICKEGLIKFTQTQCVKYGIPMKTFMLKYFNIVTNSWEIGAFELPEFRGEGLIMIPKKCISGYNELNSNFSFFISRSFEGYFQDLKRLKSLVRDVNNMEEPLKKAEIKDALKREGTTLKSAAKEAFKEIGNEDMLTIISSIRKRHGVMLDVDIESIVDTNLEDKGIDIA